MFNFIDGEFYDKELNLLIIESDFIAMFGENWDYNVLVNSNKATPRWKEIFNNLNSRGILN